MIHSLEATLSEHTDQPIPFIRYELPYSFDVVMKLLQRPRNEEGGDGVDGVASRLHRAPIMVADRTSRVGATASDLQARVSSHPEILEGLRTVHYHIATNVLWTLQITLVSHRPGKLPYGLVSPSLKKKPRMGVTLYSKKPIQVEDRPLVDSRFGSKALTSLRT